jgi:hypothetical protein
LCRFGLGPSGYTILMIGIDHPHAYMLSYTGPKQLQ